MDDIMSGTDVEFMTPKTKSGPNDLLPCPFCGGEAFIWPMYGSKYYIKVSCKKGCVIMPSTAGTGFTSEEQAKKAWNKRTERD